MAACGKPLRWQHRLTRSQLLAVAVAVTVVLPFELFTVTMPTGCCSVTLCVPLVWSIGQCRSIGLSHAYAPQVLGAFALIIVG